MYLKMYWTFITLLSAAVQTLGFQQQYFRVEPRNLRVLEGGEAVLECAVANLAGQVQWAKDGFALGFTSVIPGYPRYSMVGDRRHGVYNLRIVNTTLEDDAEYQCQVGPALMHKVIRANASLTVISPPTSVEIIDHPHNSKIEIREGTELELECLVKNAKPAAKIVWYRGSVEFKPERHEDEVKEIESGGSKKSTRYTTRSKIQIRATSDEDYAELTCEARHEGLQRDLPMRSTVQLSVLYPPGAPYIEGYAQGETVRRGQSLELVCRSRGGNPPAQLVWYKNSEQIRMAYRTSGRMSENVLSFTADASDNKARYRCEAKNIMISETLKAEIDLTVLFAPAQVSIEGATEARVGDSVSLTCTTAPSNPAAEVKWIVLGKHYKDAISRTKIASEGGWITTSNITLTIEPNRRSIVTVCHGLNVQLTENVVSTHTINVLYPPSAPLISGYTPGTTLSSGTLQKLLCISTGGNPLATLSWYKNDKKIHSSTKTSDKSVSSEISILANVTDNLAQYRCEATNSATEIPLFETVTLNVHFAPEAVKVRVEPEILKPNIEAILFCDAASSNPPASLSWWKDGIPVQGSSPVNKKGLHGGTVSTIELKLNITKDMNGAVYTCQAMNEVLQRSVHDALALKVLYPPFFTTLPEAPPVEVENNPLIITVRAEGNPLSITYTWSKDGVPITKSTDSNINERIIAEGGTLNITRITRELAGLYSCEAHNSQGAVTTNITVSVHYPAVIKQVSQNVLTDPNGDATLWCSATGNPLSEEHFSWRRKGYTEFKKKTVTSFEPTNGTSFLHIKKAAREDVGIFECVVDNNAGDKSIAKTMLIVKFKPEVDKSPNYVKSATNVGQVGKLKCKVQAAPAPTFTWSKNGATLPANTSAKYTVFFNKEDSITYTSILLVDRVTSNDYGLYDCGARNEVGFSTNSVMLNITSAPDQVMSLSVANVTHNSVTLEWVPGFDGGMQPTYRVRFRKTQEEAYKYEDVYPINTTTFTIGNLEKNTPYVFSIMAINNLGQSKYMPDTTKATTLTLTDTNELTVVPTEYESPDVSKSVVVYVSITATVLILFNAALVVFFLLRRRAKRIKEQAGQASKSATIEMYAPSSYNDTMTGETLSSVSEKSETYSNDGEEHPPEVPTMPSRHAMTQGSEAYMMDDVVIPPPLDYPPPNYAAFDSSVHTRTLPHRHNVHPIAHAHSTLGRTAKQAYAPAPSPMPPLDGSYYNMSSDRYLSYPPHLTEYMHAQIVRTPTPPVQYGTQLQTASTGHGSPPPNYAPDHNLSGGSGGGTLRRRAAAAGTGAVPPDVTVNQKYTRTPQQNSLNANVIEKQPQSILKDTSRYQTPYATHGSPISTSTPLANTSSQILTVQNLSNDIPQYGTIRKEKKPSVTIEDGYSKRNETHVV